MVGALIALAVTVLVAVLPVVLIGRWVAPGNEVWGRKGGDVDRWWPHDYGGEG